MKPRRRLSGRLKQALRVFALALIGTVLFVSTPFYDRAEYAYFDYRMKQWLSNEASEGFPLAVLCQYQESTRVAGFDDEKLMELLERLELLGVSKVYILDSGVFQKFNRYRNKLPANVEVFHTDESTGDELHRQTLLLETPNFHVSEILDGDGNLRAIPWTHPAAEFTRNLALGAGFEAPMRGERLFLKPDSTEMTGIGSSESRGLPLEDLYGHLNALSSDEDYDRLKKLYEGRIVFVEQATMAATKSAEIPTSRGNISTGQILLRLTESLQENFTLVHLGWKWTGLIFLFVVGGSCYLLSGRRPLIVSGLGLFCVGAVVVAGSRVLSWGFDAPLGAVLLGQVLAILILVLLEVRRGRRLLQAFGGAEDAKFEGEESEASMVFTNLPPFLMEMERNHDENLLKYRRDYNEVLAVVAKNYHGKVLDYQGDAQMLGFGLRYDDDREHAAEATAAAMEIVSAVAELAERWEAPPEQLSVHAGVCTGSIALGHLGAQQKQDIAAIGDTTNTAARLMGAAMKQKLPVLISKTTYIYAEGTVHGKSLPPVELKGKSAPVEVYRADSVDAEWKERNRNTQKDVSPTGGTIAYSGGNQEDLVKSILFALVGAYVMFNLWADNNFARAEAFLIDRLHQEIGYQTADPRIVIFGIDEESISDSRLGRFPWSRGVYAQAIKNLSNAGHEALFFDIMFKRARKGDEEGDKAFAEALAADSRTIVASVLFRNERFRLADPLLFPMADFDLLRERKQLGLIHVARDDDQVARSGFLTAQETNSHDTAEASLRRLYPSAAAAMYLRAGDSEEVTLSDNRKRVLMGKQSIPAYIDPEGKSTILIRYGPAATKDGLPPEPGSYHLYSFNRLLDPTDPIFDELEGKYILVGQNLTTGDYNAVDRIRTVSGNLKGVEVHARILDSLLNENYLRPMPQTDIGVLLAIVAVMTTFFLTRYRAAKTFVPRLLGAMVLLTLLQLALFYTAGVVSELFTPWACMMIVSISVLLGRYLLTYKALTMVIPAEVATELLYHHSTEDRRQEATILLTDIRGYTTLSEGRTAVAMLDVLNEYHKRTVACYERHGGQALTYQGDAQIVVFGVFGNRKNPAADAVDAALGLQAICDQLREEWGIESRDDFDVGAGLCTGEVEVGLLGGGTNLQYSVVGETVRKAHKVQSLSADLEAPVILDEETFAATQGAVKVDDLGMVQPKGLPHEIRLYRAKSVHQ